MYNFGPVNFYQRPNDALDGGWVCQLRHQRASDGLRRDDVDAQYSQAQIAASGDFFNNSFIPCNNPLLTAQEAATICSPANLAAQGNPTQTDRRRGCTPGANLYIGRRNVEGGGRVASFTSPMRTASSSGLKGDFAEAWKFDVFAQHSTVDGTLANLNYFSNTNIVNATGLWFRVRAACQPAHRSSMAPTRSACPGTSGSPNGVTAAATNYLSIPLIVVSTTTEELVSGNITGDLGHYGLKLPTADEGMKVSFGAEWRSESAQFSPDLESQLGNAAGSGGPTVPVAGNFHVKEIFTEVGIPLVNHVTGCPVAGVGRRLSLFRLQRRVQDQHLQGRYRVGAY